MSDCKEHGSDWMDLVSMSPDGSGCDEICWLCYTLEQLNDAGKNVFAARTRQAKAQALEEAAEAWENGTVDYFEIKHSSDAPLGWSDESVADAVMSSGPVMDWLRKRAKQIKDQQ